MKRNAFAIGVALLLSGCAFASKTYGPDGRESFSIKCNGLANSWATCEEKAGSLCGTRGYEIVSRTGDRGEIITANSSGAYAVPVMMRAMMVTCKG